MAANPAPDASPQTDRLGNCPKARIDGLCTSPSAPDGDSDDEVVCLGTAPLVLALSPPGGKGGTPRSRKRGSSPPSPRKRQKTRREVRQGTLDVDQRPALKTPPPTSPVSSASSAERLAFSDGRSSSLCPWCKKPVDEDRLRQFSGGSSMTLLGQRLFCSEHKKDDARDKWKARGYPKIDWASLGDRVAQHIAHLNEILRGKECYFKEIYEQVIETTKGRDRHGESPGSCAGYYGSLGSRIMLEAIEAMLFSALNEMAKDRLVSARGHAVYVEAVLVPELAVKFVMEDMGVGVERARKILEKSRDVGDVLCVDEGDTVGDFDGDDSWF